MTSFLSLQITIKHKLFLSMSNKISSLSDTTEMDEIMGLMFVEPCWLEYQSTGWW